MEILAPVGGFKQLYGAIAGKADAVYLGSNKFSARAGAENFSLEDMDEVVKLCHSEGIKIYLTVNTLFKDNEIKDALKLCVDFYNKGVDAIIIQDFGLLYLLEQYYPQIEKHASTQMSVHNLEGAKFVNNNGISRVVLARELSIDEIRNISNTGIETEVFIHGAICISYSGQCLFSSLNGVRSANRGRCAQPCRKPYKLVKNGDYVDKGFLISPKDRSYIHDMKELQQAGVTSFKIEGRLRNQYYVYETVKQYKDALNGKSYDIKKLEQIFKREDFSNTYLYNKPTSNFITKSGGSNTGIFIGKVKNGKIKLLEDINLGDGIKSNKGGFIVTKITKDDKKINSAKKGDIVTLFPIKYNSNDKLFKTASESQKKQIETAIKNHVPPCQEVEISFEFTIDKPFKIFAKDIEVLGDTVQQAINKPLTLEKIKENLEKSSSEFTKLKVGKADYQDGFMPVSKINKLRRQFIEKYEDKYLYGKKEIEVIDLPKIKKLNATQQAIKMVIIKNNYQLKALESSLTVCINPFETTKDAITIDDLQKIDKQGYSYYIKVPTIVRTEFDEIIKLIKSLTGVKGIVTANLGIINALKDSYKIIAYYDLNILNSYAALLFDYFEFIMPSIEMSKKQLKNLNNKNKMLPYIYGNLKYMNMEYSPTTSSELTENSYTLDDNGNNTIISKDCFDRITLYAQKPLNHSYKMNEYKKFGYHNFVIEVFDNKNFDLILESFSQEKGFLKENLGHYEKDIL